MLNQYCLVGIAVLLAILPINADEPTDNSRPNFLSLFLGRFCYACHNEEERESGIRVDQLDGSVPENRIKLWEEIAEQIESEEMPPEDQPQP